MDARTLTVHKAAAVIGVSSDTLRRWSDAGLIPAYRLPSGHRRFDPVDVLRFRDRLCQTKRATAEPVR